MVYWIFVTEWCIVQSVNVLKCLFHHAYVLCPSVVADGHYRMCTYVCSSLGRVYILYPREDVYIVARGGCVHSSPGWMCT